MSDGRFAVHARSDVTSAADRLRRKLLDLDLNEVGLSLYMTRYLRGVLGANVARLSVYEYLLRLALHGWSGPDSVVVDYGGGHGVFALLARESGVGTVVYVDVNPGARDDAERLAAAVDLAADQYVAGDASVLPKHFEGLHQASVAICSNDVIEHVYDLGRHLDDLTALSTRRMRLVIASEANGANPRIRRRTTSMQRDVENRDRDPDPEDRPLDSVRAYKTLRAEIIQSAAPELSKEAVEELARLTRGCAGADIERAAVNYASEGRLPDPLSHHTNTCDPLTGNWAERLMPPSSLVRMLERRGFSATAKPGRYSAFPGMKGRVAAGLNGLIRVTGLLGLVIAPYYLIIADRESQVADSS
jgi:hypothetical protein